MATQKSSADSASPWDIDSPFAGAQREVPPGADHKNSARSIPQICLQEFKMNEDNVSCSVVYIVRLH